jgi:hypothetical protein
MHKTQKNAIHPERAIAVFAWWFGADHIQQNTLQERGPTTPLVIWHDGGNIRSCVLAPWQKFKAAHSRHVDVSQNQNQRRATGIIDVLKGAITWLGEIHYEAARAEFASELLGKQHLDIGFIIDD